MKRLLCALGCLALLAGPALAQAPSTTADKVQAAKQRAARDYLQHGLIMATEGKHEAAVKSFRQSLDLDPNNAEAHSLYGSALAQVGKYAEAEAALRKAVALRPDYKEGWYYLGVFLEQRGKKQEADEAFAKARGRR